MLVTEKKGLKYYESDVSQDDQKYTGWYWCSDRKAFYRWDLLQLLKPFIETRINHD